MRLTIDVDFRVVRALNAAMSDREAAPFRPSDPQGKAAQARRTPRPDGCGTVVDIKI
jgi:hypothetical protein